jgi:DNA polymerase elongation subunit (family B)
MTKTNWKLYKEVIIRLHEKSYNSTQIFESLQLLHPNVKFPSSAGRIIRKIITKSKVKTIQKQFYKTDNHTAKILLLDIETAPMVAYLWSKWQNGISDDFIVSDWFVLSWAAKWLFEEEVLSDRLTVEELSQKDDRRIIENIWNLLEQADVIIAHNLHKFDEKKLKTRFLKHDLKTPSPYQTIDTLLHLRKQFGITSNKLDYVAKNFLEIEGKMETPRGLWQRCMEGDYEALELMDEYCQQDVRVLEEVYLRIRGWIKPHPNLALFAISEDNTCPACGGSDNEPTLTEYHTYVNTYQAHRCTDCNHIFRSRKTSTSNKKNLKVSLPK